MSVVSHRVYGTGNEVVYILHGIFGMKDNWHHIAGLLSRNCIVVTLDARNHGKSFHDHEMSYESMANDVAGLMVHLGHDKINLIGHSMGGKTSMKFASLFPEKLHSLMIVDIALRKYPPGHLAYFRAFENIDFLSIQSRTEADQAFAEYAPELAVRQFLLKNLEPIPGGGYRPKFNLPAIENFYQESIGMLELPANSYLGPTLCVRGESSSYVLKTDEPEMLRVFPHCEFRTIHHAGHWVHADNPEEFLTQTRQFLRLD